MSASKGWCTNTDRKASRTTIFLITANGERLLAKTLKGALVWGNFLSGRHLLLP